MQVPGGVLRTCLSRIPPPPLMGAPYKESLEVSYRNLASQLADCKKLACLLYSPLICSPCHRLLLSLNRDQSIWRIFS